ncbi:OPT/YSL family transporter [Candidatus Babeliales bacterium]|nr:OPT/YSL family transporter [Candidatus Babeliales bacterium]
MNLFVGIVGTFFALFSSIILAYVSMVTGIGPWIAPTLVLFTSVLLKLRRKRKPQHIENQEMALTQTVGSVGALVAVAIGFTLPTLYFLDPEIFNSWIASPFYFCSIIAGSILSAGALGMYLARLFGEKLVYREKLKFPVSLLIHRMITSQSEGWQIKHMLTGLSSTGLFCFIRDGFYHLKGLFPKVAYLLPSIFGKELAFAFYQGPTLWAVGFIAGAVISVPLAVGMLSKYLILYPINHHAVYLPFKLFDPQDSGAFNLAFCSGLVLVGTFSEMRKYPKILFNTVKDYVDIKTIKNSILKLFLGNNMPGILPTPMPSAEIPKSKFFRKLQTRARDILDFCIVFFGVVAFLSYLKFSFASQLFIIVFTLVAAYQLCLLGASVGLIPFGRFATFVMIPAMLIFKLDYIQITILCVFVNICSAVASDLLFDYKVGELCDIKFKRIRKYQWLGLIVSALGMGFLLWLIFTNFQVGSPELFAYRGKTRALLVQSTNFNYWVLLLGGLYGLIVKKFRVNPALVLSGILMPNSISIGLIAGGILSKFFKKPDNYLPFWSGVFASESIWMLINMLMKLVGA